MIWNGERAFPPGEALPSSRRIMDSKKLSALCRELADAKKAENIVILDLRDLAGVVDYMVICTGTSDPHLRAIQEEIATKLRDVHRLRPRAVDGTRNSGWVVLDYVDVLVHVMKPDARERYDLEGLWNDAPSSKKAAKKSAKRAGRKRAKASGEPVVEAGGIGSPS